MGGASWIKGRKGRISKARKTETKPNLPIHLIWMKGTANETGLNRMPALATSKAIFEYVHI